jgi:hypothetical protein
MGSLFTDPTYRKTIVDRDASSFSAGGPSPLVFPEQGPIVMPKKPTKGGHVRSAPVEEEPEP